MSRNVERRRLDRPAHEVAGLVLDWSRDGEWREAVVRMEVEPAGELTASFAGGNATVAVEGRRTVDPEADGSCVVVLEVDVRMTGSLAVLNPLLAPTYRRRLAFEADALAALVAAPA